MAEPGGTRALENSGNYTTERGGNDRAEMGWKLTTEPGWIKNGIRTEKTGRKCSQRDYPHEQLWRAWTSRSLYRLSLTCQHCQAYARGITLGSCSDARERASGKGPRSFVGGQF